MRRLKSLFFFIYKRCFRKFAHFSQSSVSLDSIYAMILTIQSSFKTELGPILNLVLRLPTNAPRPIYVLQRGESAVGSSKGSVEDKGVVVGRFLSMQIPTSILMKPFDSSLTTTSTKTNPFKENVDFSKVQKKGISINEGGGGTISLNVHKNSNVDPKDKGKIIQVEQFAEEKKRFQDIEFERQRQINNNLNLRVNDPTG